ncbi:MAG: glutamate 5-kinase [Verrucomicrobiota bacterium]
MVFSEKRIVVKVGSGLLAGKDGGINIPLIESLAAQIADLKNAAFEVIMVSSGAISAGMSTLKKDKRPSELADMQACASIGQPILMSAYQKAFETHGLCAAQILVTSWDFDSRKLYDNAQATLQHLLHLGNCVPVFNENDALSFEEIAMLNRFGDNDTLSAQVTLLAKAGRLIILTSIDGLRTSPENGDLISHVSCIDDKIESYARDTASERSVGGMLSKLQTAQLMMDHQIPMHIADGRVDKILPKLLIHHEKIGTLFLKD